MILTPPAPRQAPPHQKFKRLIRTSDFMRAYRQGRRVRGHVARIYYLPNQRAFSRLGVVVSKRVSKKATDRNWHKRVIREWFMQHANIATVGHLDIVIMVIKAMPTTQPGSAELRRALALLSQQILT